MSRLPDWEGGFFHWEVGQVGLLVKANVVFFTKGSATERVWIYDARTHVPCITKKDRPLTSAHFAEFGKCYGPDPNGHSKRKPADSKEDRWRSFRIADVSSARLQARQLQMAQRRIPRRRRRFAGTGKVGDRRDCGTGRRGGV